MTRLLWVYGLLPTSLTIVAGFVAWSLGSSGIGVPLLYGILVVSSAPLLFAFVTYKLLVDVYKAGSYLIAYHELGSDHQYVLRTRFTERFVRRARGNVAERGAVPWGGTSLSAGVFYTLLGAGGILVMVSLRPESLQLGGEATLIGLMDLAVVGLLATVAVKLVRIPEVMERSVLEFVESRAVGEVSFIFDELAQKSGRRSSADSAIAGAAAGTSFCPRCGKPVPATAKFCNKCGAKIGQSMICANCKADVPAGSKFCPNCGKEVE